jgi:hypothetical protein
MLLLLLLLSCNVCFRLHNAGIQVILDVVYNHTAELDDKHPYLLSMRCVTFFGCRREKKREFC